MLTQGFFSVSCGSGSRRRHTLHSGSGAGAGQARVLDGLGRVAARLRLGCFASCQGISQRERFQSSSSQRFAAASPLKQAGDVRRQHISFWLMMQTFRKMIWTMAPRGSFLQQDRVAIGVATNSAATVQVPIRGTLPASPFRRQTAKEGPREPIFDPLFSDDAPHGSEGHVRRQVTGSAELTLEDKIRY